MQERRPVEIVKKLRAAGYEAYFVGGCVRDMLLGRQIHDWDITTSALPEETMACFAHCIPTGIRHGTVTVLLEDCQAEVTTYRTDGSYADGRHPEQVTFVRSLAEDLARRDFTINAMAMDETGTLTDLYGGRTDLQAKLLRCVGDPERRFREDALRMLRALRFSAQLGFEIEEQTREAIAHCSALCAQLSVERIRDELEKTLLSQHPERIEEMISLGLLKQFAPELTGGCGWLAALPAERAVRWAGLCRVWPELDLMKLRLDRRTARDAMESARLPVPRTRMEWKYLIAEKGKVQAMLLSQLEGKQAVLQELLESGECLCLKELAVNGGDFPNVCGERLGELLHTLLYHVLEYPEDNHKEKLFNISKISIDYCY